MTLFEILGIALLFMFFTWGSYVGIMNLMENKKKLTLPAKFFAYPLALIGILQDVTVNVVIGTVLFLELPKEFLFTARLQRQIEHGNKWRAAIAHWICSNLLDPFDPRGYHCCKPTDEA